jgi:CheY-like chemotaxis protein
MVIKPRRTLFGSLRSISRQEGEDLRSTNQRLERELADLRAFQKQLTQQERLGASDLVHDFNNALTPILGFSELLLTNEAVLHHPAQARRFVEMLHESAREIAKLVGRLSEFSQQPATLAGSTAVPASAQRLEVFPDAAPARLSILVVDDDERVCEVVAEYLVGDGHEVTVATSGREALAQIEREKFDVVFLDRAMPQMSGDEAAELIKQLRPQLPVIMLTGYGALIEVTGAVDGVLGKPVTLAVLRQTLARFLHAA